MYECVGGWRSGGYVRSSKGMSYDIVDAAAIHVVLFIYHGVQLFFPFLFKQDVIWDMKAVLYKV